MSSRTKRMLELCTKARTEIINLNNVEDNIVYECEIINNNLVSVSDLTNETPEPRYVNRAVEESKRTETVELIIDKSNDIPFLPPEGDKELDYTDFPTGTEYSNTEEVTTAIQNIPGPTFSEYLVNKDQAETRAESVEKSFCENDADDPEDPLLPRHQNEILNNNEIEANQGQNGEHDNIGNKPEEVINGIAENGKRRKLRMPNEWRKNKNKKLRMMGENYMGYSKSTTGTIKHNVERNARTLKFLCNSSNEFCKKSVKRNCSLFIHEKRQEIFKHFWKMTWEQKKVYVLSLVIYQPKDRCYVTGVSRRQGTFLYHLRSSNAILQVCKKFFLSTLDLKEKMVRLWVMKNQNHGTVDTSQMNNDRKYEKRRESTFAQSNKGKIDFLKAFFDGLAKMESHYCRKDTSKKYLQFPFQSKTDVYKLYSDHCKAEQETPLSIFTFTKIFESQNLSIYHPRKDQCDICCQYKAKQLPEEDYQQHIEKKNSAQKEKTNDKEAAIQGNNYTFTMDVQAVKLCPVIKASSLYYKTRLQVHIFTIYNLATHQCTNYVWNETEGDLQASIFVSCIINHLEVHCLNEKREIILFSDGCGYQNRNSVLANALSLFSVENNICVQQKFLEKGHTQMECDSTHALIERKLKGREITLPSQYVSVVKEARKKPCPLDVEYLTHDFFKNYDEKSIIRFESIRPGKMKNDPTVSDLRNLKYLPSGEIQYKLIFTDEYKDLPQRTKMITLADVNIKPLFKERLPIKSTKWKHLQDLKPTLDKEVHSFYDELPHSPKENLRKTRKDN